MKLDSVQIQNFRGFEHFEATLDPRFTLVIGDNGAGKSALLDALAVALGAWFLGFPDMQARRIRDDEIRQVLHERVNGPPNLEPVYPSSVSARGVIQGRSIEWSRQLHGRGGRTTYGDARELRELAAQTQKRVSAGEDIDLPVIAYYGTGRLWVQKRDSAIKEAGLGSRLNGYIDCLEPASNQKLFEAWMRWREQERLQRVAEMLARGDALPSPAPGLSMPEVDAVVEAVTTCVEDASGVFYDVRHEELRIDFRGGQALPFRMLSDGYRNFLGMVADLAWRTVQLNPHLGRSAPRETRGVVLIDEIDLHLHPRWQQRVVGDLATAFPEVQFIATTHSPQVISTATQSSMRILVPGSNKPLAAGHVEGRDTNAILEDIMGVSARPKDMRDELERLARLIDGGKTDAARELLEQLTERLGEDDAAIVAARWELHDPLPDPES